MILKIAAGVFIGAVLLLLYGIWIERYLVRFPRYKIPVPNLPPAFHGFTIVHISDVHYGPLVPYWFLKRLFAKVNALDKDLIVCTGDYVSGKNVPERVDTAWSLLRALDAPFGAYSVLGNCDHWADARRSREQLALSDQDIQGKAIALTKEGGCLWIAGAGDLLEDHIPLDHILENIPPDACRIVLAHNPDSADTEFSERIDLLLAGHTHGGQVNIPWYGIPMLPVKNKTYSFGLKTSPKGHLVFISKGIGWGIFPGRLNCFPEIPIIELLSVNEPILSGGAK
jgi:predicted MPP superfamily phosphohydrolase